MPFGKSAGAPSSAPLNNVALLWPIELETVSPLLSSNGK